MDRTSLKPRTSNGCGSFHLLFHLVLRRVDHMGLALIILRRRADTLAVRQSPLLSLTTIWESELLIPLSIFLDPLTVSEGRLQVIVTETPSILVMLTEQWDDRFTRGATVVMWDAAEEVAATG